MTNKIVAVQGNHPSTLNPATDTSIFLANEIQNKYKIFYYEPKNLSIINKKVFNKLTSFQKELLGFKFIVPKDEFSRSSSRLKNNVKPKENYVLP